MNGENDQPVRAEDAEKVDLNKRLEAIGWGLFLTMIGGLWLVPDERVPEGTWLIGAGVIMLGLNLARYMNQVKTSRFTIVLGTIALLIGFSDYLGVELPLIPILIILLGANMIYGVLTRRKGAGARLPGDNKRGADAPLFRLLGPESGNTPGGRWVGNAR